MPLKRLPPKPVALAAALGLVAATTTVLVFRDRKNPPALPPSPTHSTTIRPISDSDRRVTPEIARQLAAIEAREAEASRTVWAGEQTAEACTAVIDAVWDDLNAAPDRLARAASHAPASLRIPRWAAEHPLAHGIVERRPEGSGTVLDPDAWRARLGTLSENGWRLETTEFRHVRFEPASGTADQPGISTFQFTAHLTRHDNLERATLEGPLMIHWSAPESSAAPPGIREMDATHLTLRRRPGPPPFRPILEATITPPPRGQSIDPLVVRDLDGDGYPELILVARNLVYRRNAGGGYDSGPLCQHPPDTVYTAVMADFNRDGHVDLLSLGYPGLHLHAGTGAAHFGEAPRLVWKTGSARPVEFPMALTCADIDQDGDLDVFLGQYRDPYEGGAVPTPYYAATNGHPSFLLLQTPGGEFEDVTGSAGLGPLQGRRIYSASLVDLDGDRHPDLATASDFAGIDLYRNDGRGRFTDVTSAWIGNPHAFGMALGVADYNADARLDLLLIGMSSPTVDRLEHLQLFRPGIPGDRERRAAMTHGNRLYLGSVDGPFAESELGRSIARSGWSWGCGTGDFDNDGYPDVHIVNGLESRRTVRDYESEYWRHDLFVGGAADDPAALLYFKTKIARTRGRGWSYGGYEKNRLYLNQAGRTFLEAGHLLGVALEQDSRNCVAADMDADGRIDLAVTSFATWPDPRQTLRVFRNELPETGHWIAFSVADSPDHISAPGTRIEIRHGRGRQAGEVVTGDSHRSQHPPVLHFGLGTSAAGTVDEVRITWPDRTTTVLKNVAADRVHPIRRP